jgi:hypothetical protein
MVLRNLERRNLEVGSVWRPDPDDAAKTKEVEMKISKERFERDFKPRGITRRVAEFDDGFVPYEEGETIPPEAVFVGDPMIPFTPTRRPALGPGMFTKVARARAARQPGMMMRRWPVPEADPFLTAQQRPDKAILPSQNLAVAREVSNAIRWHKHRIFEDDERTAHINKGSDGRGGWRKSTTGPDDIRNGLTSSEFERVSGYNGFAVTQGGDHFGIDTDALHLHVRIAKYVFVANTRVTKTRLHDHSEMDGREETESRNRRQLDQALRSHLIEEHELMPLRRGEGRMLTTVGNDPETRTEGVRTTGGSDLLEPLLQVASATVTWGVDPFGEEHDHEFVVDSDAFAMRLSWHPYQREERWQRERVCFPLEGSMKETALVSVGEATFACPSVTLWNAPELADFAEEHLRGKTVFVITDSDWDRTAADGYIDSEAVIRQGLRARNRLRSLGVRAEVAAPTPEPEDCELHGEPEGAKRGADDAVGDGLKVDDFIWVDRNYEADLWQWCQDNDIDTGTTGRDYIDTVNEVLMPEMALYASEDGLRQTTYSHVGRRIYEANVGRWADENTATRWTKTAVERLFELGALEETRRMTLNRRRYAWGEDEWKGQVRVHEDLRATTIKRKVGDIGQAS